MKCPGCESAMERLTLEAVLGTTVDVDLCPHCRAFWFEPFETLHLTPASTLTLIRMIADHSSSPHSPFPTHCHCPKCRSRLLVTRDRQRNTPFEYLRCDRGHGRFTRYTDFLKEKDFVRPLSPPQLRELRLNIRTIHCSNCGAAIDLVRESVCQHCGSPVSMLDIRKMAELAGALSPTVQDQAPRRAVSEERIPPTASELSMLLRSVHREPGDDLSDAIDLVDSGLLALGSWLRKLTG